MGGGKGVRKKGSLGTGGVYGYLVPLANPSLWENVTNRIKIIVTGKGGG